MKKSNLISVLFIKSLLKKAYARDIYEFYITRVVSFTLGCIFRTASIDLITLREYKMQED